MFSQNRISLRQNILANFAGQGWSLLIGMVTVPFYLHFLGVEGYGLVGFYGALKAIFNLFLDFGLSMTIKREIARYSAFPNMKAQTRDLVRTMEVPYWIIGLFLGFIVYLSASLISTYWIRSETIPAATIQNVIVIMAIITFFQWPLTFYIGGLVGLQKIVLLNGINVIVATLRGVGGILAVWLFPSPIIAFFLWQVALSVIQLGMTANLFWRNLPTSDHAPRFQKSIIAEIWRFALGMSGTSFNSFFLYQADKIFLSIILPLDQFGYYSIAVILKEQLQYVNAIIIEPLFPRFSVLISLGDQESLRDLYHKSCQLLSVIILPIAGTAVFFSRELIYLWTQDLHLATIVAPTASLLLAGTALLNMMGMPRAFTIAHGWVKLTFYQSLILSVLFIPLMVVLSIEYAGVGAALAWAILNFGQLIVLPVFIHRKILIGELKQWYLFDVGIPLIASLGILAISRWVMPLELSKLQNAFYIGITASITFVVVVFLTREARAWGKEWLDNYLPNYAK